jgi:phosphatidylglycerophosphatase A
MINKTPTFQQLLTNPVHLLAFGFGFGLAKKGPGTAGTLIAVPIYYGLFQMGSNTYLASLIFISLAGIWICGKTAEDIGVHDHGGIVWDEIAGFLLTMLWVSFSWLNVLLGFIYFRLFDILKPWPINVLDRHVKGGFGIMVDDILAGFMAALCLYLTNQFIL